MAFVLVCLTPGSPAYGHEESRVHSVRVHAHVEQVLYEASAPLDLSVAVVAARPWRYSTVVLGRALLAAPAPALQCIQTPHCSTSSFDYIDRPVWRKYRRHACQLLDTPPPSLSPRVL